MKDQQKIQIRDSDGNFHDFFGDYFDGSMESMRKGAWDAHEDILLRNCIEKYGEGKWHLVSQRAGLNRCRKSCRLRWLNYLKPNIKRGDFDTDEVDLMIRLHKLLGNRWSFIAGRLPGRTGNDVKNYWNTHVKKLVEPRPQPQDLKTAARPTAVLKPRPRTISKNINPSCLAQEKIASPSNDQNMRSGGVETNNNITNCNCNISNNNIILSKSLPQTPPADDGNVQWWNKFLEDNAGTFEGEAALMSFVGSGNQHPLTDFWTNHEIISAGTKAVNNFVEEGKNEYWSDLWDFLSSDLESDQALLL